MEKFHGHPSWRCRSVPQISYLSVAWDCKVTFRESRNKLPFFSLDQSLKLTNHLESRHNLEEHWQNFAKCDAQAQSNTKTKVQMSGARLWPYLPVECFCLQCTQGVSKSIVAQLEPNLQLLCGRYVADEGSHADTVSCHVSKMEKTPVLSVCDSGWDIWKWGQNDCVFTILHPLKTVLKPSKTW